MVKCHLGQPHFLRPLIHRLDLKFYSMFQLDNEERKKKIKGVMEEKLWVLISIHFCHPLLSPDQVVVLDLLYVKHFSQFCLALLYVT